MPMIEVTEYEELIFLGIQGMRQAIKKEILEEVDDTRLANSKQTLITQGELANKWSCSKKHVGEILKKYGIEAVGKSGKEYEYDINQAQEAKNTHDGLVIYQDKLNRKMRAM